jgi:hypothetical protein
VSPFEKESARAHSSSCTSVAARMAFAGGVLWFAAGAPTASVVDAAKYAWTPTAVATTDDTLALGIRIDF